MADILQTIDGITFKLKTPFDLAFIHRYGTVFKVFDDQDSGNLCFGLHSGDARYFVKFAGACTVRYDGDPRDAIDRLRATVPVYRDLAHPNLVRFVKAEEVGGGYAILFDWVDGECMGRMYPQSRQKFISMPLETKLRVFEDILAFHAFVISKGYVAIDFYDGSLLYDFERDKTVICDIDCYEKRPYINQMGRLWGSSRFMSPEEFTLGASIDEVTNVYTMGAMAFALFSAYDRTPVQWSLSDARYDVVKSATSDERALRPQSIAQLTEEWMRAK
jgi:serine/threonine-protein kinase